MLPLLLLQLVALRLPEGLPLVSEGPGGVGLRAGERRFRLTH